MKNNLSRKAAAVILCGFMLLLMLITIIRENGIESNRDDNTIAEKTNLSFDSIIDGSYFKVLGGYFTGNFGGRSSWISVKGAIDAEVGESIVNGVYILDNMLLDAEGDAETFDDRANEINEYASSYNGAVYLVAVPSSSGVYSELMPEYLTVDTEKQRIDSFYSQLDSSIRTIDAYNILKTLNDNYIYYRNDSKWTSYGAYCVYRTVIQKLGFLPTAYDKYTIEHVTGDFRGNLYNRTQYAGVKADMIDIYNYSEGEYVTSCMGYKEDGSSFEKEIYDKSCINSKDMYSLYLGEDVPLIKITTSVKNDRKLLVIKDSYADCFIPFLIQHYSEIAVISPENFESGISSILERDEYEQTLFLFGTDDFPSSKSLKCINN